MKALNSLLVLVLALLPLAAVAANESENKVATWNYSASTIVMSRYYGSIVGGIFYSGREMSFTDLIARRTDSGGSTYFDLSIGKGLDNWSYNKGNDSEIDLTIGRSFTVGSKDFPVKVDAAVCYLALHDLNKINGDCVSTDLRFDLPKVLFVQPYLVIYRFDMVGQSGSGWFTYGGLLRSQPLPWMVKSRQMTLEFDYRIGYSGDLLGTKPGIAYHRISISLPISLSDKWSVTPTLIGQIKGNQPQGYAFVDKARVFWTVLINRTF